MTAAHLQCRPVDKEKALAEAEALCRARSAKLTPLRRTVLDLLLERGRPVKAYDLLKDLRDDGEAKPPTIYRALQFLQEMGLVHRIESMQAFSACAHWRHGHTAVFLICDLCGEVAEAVAGDSAKRLMQEALQVNFKAHTATIEVHGHCGACAA